MLKELQANEEREHALQNDPKTSPTIILGASSLYAEMRLASTCLTRPPNKALNVNQYS
jgi:hypothetical protein